MKTLALVVGMTAVLACQSGGGPIAGTWTAQFEGRRFLTLELKTVNGTITGGMSVGNIEVDGQGAVRRVGELPRDLRPIFDVTQHASTVTFSRQDSAASDTDRFELRMLEDGHAELQFLVSDADRKELAASGIPTPKPIPLTRQ
jgi:hypothetical protein